jgi:hypothetical protein
MYVFRASLSTILCDWVANRQNITAPWQVSCNNNLFAYLPYTSTSYRAPYYRQDGLQEVRKGKHPQSAHTPYLIATP